MTTTANPTADQVHLPVQHAEEFAWAVFAENGNVIIWSKSRHQVESASQKYGRPVVPIVAVSTTQQAASPSALAILRDVHDTLASESDSDIDHFEDEDEEREGAPVQYAARKIMQVIDELARRAASVSAPAAFPKRDSSKPAEQQGLFCKFDVRRVDDSDQPGGKHFGCRHYVLDLTHDQHAPAALRAYADSCATTHPELSADLRAEYGRTPDTEVRGQDAAVAAIQFALEDEDGLDFLRYWNEGEFDVIRRNWENVPEAIFIGADPMHSALK